ncbi:Lrp/AsnC ligand binding domain-containing protein [Chloroflexota bacterium]
MATKAFILIETTVGRTREVAISLNHLEGVKSVDLVSGPYDVIAVIERQNTADIGDLVTSKIHPVPGVSRTITCLS